MKKRLLIAVLTVCMGWMSTSVWALDQKEGVYQINNADDLLEFSNLVISTPDASAVLTADIDLNGKDYQPIGIVGVPYTGTFDGQEHRVKNMLLEDDNAEYLGMFGVISGGAVIRNIIIDKTCYVSGKGYCAGLVGGTNGGGEVLIENCGNEGDVMVTEANAGGIMGVDMGSQAHMTVRGCWNTGSIVGGRESATISGWLGDNPVIIGCYNIGDVTGVDNEGRDLFRSNGIGNGKMEKCFSKGTTQTNVKDIDMSTVATGALAYLMNGNTSSDPIWFQNLDNGKTVDNYPVSFSTHGTVYAVGTLNCDGTPAGDSNSFSNTDASVPTPHTLVDGICSVCGFVDMNYLALGADGFYSIANAKELNWFAHVVNGGENTVKARLTADIDFSDYTLENVMIGHGQRFKGVFDGQEHSINVKFVRDENDAALFCHLEGANIKNLFVTGEIESSAQFAAGLFVDSWGATVIENVVTKVDIVGTMTGDATYGGISAVAHDNLTVRNCAVLGSILADNCHGIGGMVGYTHGGGSTRFINCLVAAADIYVNTAENNSVICRNNPTIINSYFFDSFGMTEDNGAAYAEENTGKTGELCFALNGKVSGGENWFQNIGEDDLPIPFASHKKVYAIGTLKCNGTPDNLTYSNTDGQPTRAAHQYDANGVCTVCDSRLVKTAEQLQMAADDINLGASAGTIDITLDADIDMGAQLDFQGIGTREAPFMGNFDGQGHIISNMTIQTTGSNNHGLISVTKGDVTVKNVTVDSSCSISLYEGGYAAGIVAATIGSGTLLIENCGNEAEVYTEGPNSAGIFGVSDLSQTAVTIRNCYNTGEITGQRESAGISGWLGNNAVVENCYSTGYVTGLDGNNTFARQSSGAQFINCYETMGTQVIAIEDLAILESGELCYKLNGSKNGVDRFYQNIGTDKHPVLHGSTALVYFDGTDYTNTPTGIEGISAGLIEKGAQLFTISGARVNQMQKGVNIVRMADGKVKKYIVK